MDDIAHLEELHRKLGRVREELARVIVGQQDVVDQLLLGLLSGGHSLLVGVPGLAKTLMVKTFARVLDLGFNRVQFTPDLMPSDITGTEIIDADGSTGHRAFRFVQGPVFTNILLSDEINRAPPRTQSALLEAMQEHRVTSGGQTFSLEEPFYVLATQNPIEQEGTYPLPEAQLDRFMLMIWVDYPSLSEEEEIVSVTTGTLPDEPEPVLDKAAILDAQRLVRDVPVDSRVVNRAVMLARDSRPTPDAPAFIRDWVSWGAGPRAGQYLVLGAKARAVLDGRKTPSIDDVDALALPVLRHRIVTNFNADADGVKTSDIIERLLAHGR
jgi:MoxR-like ATPase